MTICLVCFIHFYENNFFLIFPPLALCTVIGLRVFRNIRIRFIPTFFFPQYLESWHPPPPPPPPFFLFCLMSANIVCQSYIRVTSCSLRYYLQGVRKQGEGMYSLMRGEGALSMSSNNLRREMGEAIAVRSNNTSHSYTSIRKNWELPSRKQLAKFRQSTHISCNVPKCLCHTKTSLFSLSHHDRKRDSH